MVIAMVHEMEMQKDYLKGETIDTIYFGGGTPSILEIHQLEKFLNKANQIFYINNQSEITLEANPDDLANEKLRDLKSLGINRLSIGIQSFDDKVLRYLNRAHHATEAINCVHFARDKGFDNISIDLIFSIPIAFDKVLKEDIETGLSLAPEHISAYSLTIEEKTVFGKWSKKGKLHPVSDKDSASQFEFLMATLEKDGYEQYEVSNFCRDGYYSRHNTLYWKDVPYLGIGPGAHSYNGGSRQFNVPHNPKYIKSIATGEIPFEREILDITSRTNEFILTSLRTKWGCDLTTLKQKFGYDLLEACKSEMENFLNNELIAIDKSVVYLTKKGILVADEVIGRLFLDPA
jgi:oxygen-independent coproporphyrinogen-3 oxidase